MAPISRAVASAARIWTRHTLPHPTTSVLPKPSAAITCQQTRNRADSAFDSPFQPRKSDSPKDQPYADTDFDSPYHRSGGTSRTTTDIPDWSKYKSGKDELTNRVFQYFMVGSFGAITAMGAKATVQGMLFRSCRVHAGWLTVIRTDFLVNMSASADVLAQAKVEIDLSQIPLGKNVRPEYLSLSNPQSDD